MKSVRDISVQLPYDSIYKVKVLPPMVIIFLRITEKKQCLNQEVVDQAKADIAAWRKTSEAAEGGTCSIKEIPEIWGYTLEYNYSPEHFKHSVLDVFDSMVTEFSEVIHIEKLVMDRIFFPKPRYITSVTSQEPHVLELRNKISLSIDSILLPMMNYVTLFRQYEDFVNVDINEYVNSKIQVQHRDPESSEIELPVTVNQAQVIAVLEDHLAQVTPSLYLHLSLLSYAYTRI